MLRILAAAMLMALVPACSSGDAFGSGGAANAADGEDAANRVTVTIEGANGSHVFHVEVARTEEEQARGLMFRKDIPKDGGMLFAPYPAAGGGPKPASFWMKNTPSSLDILFIRADHSIARLTENTVPFSEAPIPSGEPVAAVLEINAGRAAELGINEGDKVTWGK
ncbi:DUF192 domain-containing protein [uncultured Sphingomonas sp.]|uniref:DUF192 domain-containing protein n=1 Tax=uncultured Sphingomonas sp. TaxID=158754 RepID=UPI00261D9E03|nr:DUF192 domain-containing protein [uncultured Sphingomonas sp.]